MRLWRYYLAGMFRGFAVAAGVVLAIFFLFDLISEADSVGSGGYTFLDAAAVVLLMLPGRFVELSPVVAMLGVIYALGVFGRNVELVAIRATGISTGRLAAMAVVAALTFYVAVAAVEIAARPLHQTALSFRMLQVAQRGQPVRGDLWIADPAGIVRISDWEQGMQPSSVELFVFRDDGTLARYLQADQIRLDATGTWHFAQASVTDFEQQRVRPERVADVSWKPDVYKNLTLFDLPVQGMSMPELRDEMLRRDAAGEADVDVRLEWFKRLLLPLSGLTFAAFAAALGLKETERGGLGQRLAIGVLAALILYLGQQIVLNASLVAGLGPLAAVALPTLAVGVLAAVLLRRAA